jgi:hypothetical protein
MTWQSYVAIDAFGGGRMMVVGIWLFRRVEETGSVTIMARAPVERAEGGSEHRVVEGDCREPGQSGVNNRAAVGFPEHFVG